MIRECGGNPLAIVELAADRPEGVLPAPVAPLPAAGRMEEHFRGRLLVLPERTRWALLLAAADDRSDLTAFAAAAEQLGLSVADLEPAELQRLVRVTAGGLEFRHPLVRAAAYQDIPLARRPAAHQAPAAVLVDARDAAGPVLLARCAELARELPAGRDEVRDCLIGVPSLLGDEPAGTTAPLRAPTTSPWRR